MTITQITFKRTVNTGNFENFAVEATAAVMDGDDPDTAAIILQRFVDTVCLERMDRTACPAGQGGMDAGERRDPPWVQS